MTKIKVRERRAIVQSLRAGVVPKVGLQHIQVGRDKELTEIIRDLDSVKEGAAAIRYIVANYGSGKTFFLTLSRLIALNKGFIVMHGDLSPKKKIYSSSGESRSLFCELTQHISTRSKTSGGALESILQRYINAISSRAQSNSLSVKDELTKSLTKFRNYAGGYDFAEVIKIYFDSYEDGDEKRQQAVMRWLRGEYATKTDARRDLGVRCIIHDDNWYDYLKLYARFVSEAGYSGLVVCIDEAVNIMLIQHGSSRAKNYEFLLRILNDILQGVADHLSIMIGGTEEFLEDEHRGVASHEALYTRLRPNEYASEVLVDLSGPVMKLPQLTKEECFVLIQKIREVMQSGEKKKLDLPDEALQKFLDHCYDYIGEAYFQTPRKTIKAFVDFVSLLKQNPSQSWKDILQKIQVEPDHEDDFAAYG